MRSELIDLARTAPGGLAVAHRSALRTLLLLVWTLAIVLDGYTTVAMMGAGISEEANPVAAAAMSVIGVLGYTMAASLLSAALCLLALGRPTGLYSWTVVATIALVGCAKLAQGAANALLWVQLT
ncbi:hypothetical protein E8D34_08160 [Nocardioides sp. GY 10113]|uniref:DUF5658 family protein n=1 Tax=Nocardioides sp. GY 10113 TaxID=2569761 RepID=UPI0010A85BFB|nr:DUF5658 family protein [Nocardioides sp. GY 10113]TIC87651.1 hypothetical protein E8D34_08160 [Nocardioides sp. GY 10113]